MKKLANEYFDVVPLMKEKQRRKKKKERDKNKEPKETKKKDKKEERQKRRKERDREREIEKGGAPKKLRRNKGRHSKINKKCPFLRGKQFFCITKQRKERNNNKPKKTKKKTQKKKPQKKQQKYQKKCFSVISQFVPFFWVTFRKISLF